jgi:copper chaperone
MDEKCYVEPIKKDGILVEQLESADTATLAIRGMGCENCATRVRNSLLSLDGVHTVDIYLNMALAEVRYDGNKIPATNLVAAVSRAGNDGRHHYVAELLMAD